VLRELHISELGVIGDLDLELHAGLNVLTGETGAGKTMVTVGLALALGARAGASLVRDGSEVARVQARFDAVPGSEEWAEEGEVILARTVGRDGKSTARVCGQLATASTLSELGGALVEVHGQHQTQRLLSTTTQTALLDRFAGAEHLEALSSYRGAWDRWRAARTALDELAQTSRDRERELDLLGHQVREIETIGPQPGESDRLAAEEARLAHVERLLDLASAAEETLTGDGSIADGIAGVAAGLADAARLDTDLAAVAGRAGGLAAEIAELGRDVRVYREGLLIDPDRLQDVRERIAALKGLQRKYGATDADVLGFGAEAADRLAALENADDRLTELTAEVEALGAELSAVASVVSEGRRSAAPRLAEAIERELHELGMPGSRLEVRLAETPELTPTGAERAELRLAPSPGQRPALLARTASGGELSRTMLACRSVLADLDQVPTLVFDEVDAGIGGEAGLAVGRRLARLAADRQVLVVTHLPQIACFADRHILVDKRDGTAGVRTLDDDERVHELSRMLAGLTGSEGAVTHAEELLAAAAFAKPAR